MPYSGGMTEHDALKEEILGLMFELTSHPSIKTFTERYDDQGRLVQDVELHTGTKARFTITDGRTTIHATSLSGRSTVEVTDVTRD